MWTCSGFLKCGPCFLCLIIWFLVSDWSPHGVFINQNSSWVYSVPFSNFFPFVLMHSFATFGKPEDIIWVQLYFSRRPHAAADARSSLGQVSSEKKGYWGLQLSVVFSSHSCPPFKILLSDNLLQFYCEISKKKLKTKFHLISLSQITLKNSNWSAQLLVCLVFLCLEFSYFQGEG